MSRPPGETIAAALATLRAWLAHLRDGVRQFRVRVRRAERREVREFRAWLERTDTVVHLSALLFVPLLLGTVTLLSNTLAGLSYLLFPPLASGTYTLFARPESEYASVPRFVGGLTAGALCGWVALTAAATVGASAGDGAFAVGALEAGLAVLLVGVATWPLHVEEPSAYATALIALLVPAGSEPAFVVSVFLATLLVGAVFVVWRDRFFEQRAKVLYQSVRGDDHVLVPLRGAHADATATLGARLAAAHDAGKVVLLDVVDDEAVAAAERARIREGDALSLAVEVPDGGTTAAGAEGGAPSDGDGDAAAGGESADAGGEDDVSAAVADAVDAIERRAAALEADFDVPCEVVVAADGRDLGGTVLDAARATGSDLVVAPHENEDGRLAAWLDRLFRGDVDVLVHRSADGRTDWRDVMVPVRRASDVAHRMVEFGRRIAGTDGEVVVCTCIGPDGDRRRAIDMLADIVGPFDGHIDTRVSRDDVASFLAEHADEADLVLVGASRDRSAASRLLAPPTFRRLADLEGDVGIVDRAR